MKKSILVLYLIVCSSIFSLILTDNNAFSKDKTLNSKVIIYYLHNSYRCSSCLEIENYTKESVNANFAKELKDGSLVFKSINFDEKPYKHYVEDYKLYTKSVVLSRVKNGKQTECKNLDKIWELLRDKAKFQQYINTETAKFLKGSK